MVIENSVGSMDVAAPRKLLTELRHALLGLHKMLLETEREAYVQLHGQVSSGEMLRLVLEHEQFAWLRFVSGLVVTIDELLDYDDPLDKTEVDNVLAEARKLLTPAQISKSFEEKYQAALQNDAATIMKHRDIRELLTSTLAN